jgi:hypothetical protein
MPDDELSITLAIDTRLHECELVAAHRRNSDLDRPYAGRDQQIQDPPLGRGRKRNTRSLLTIAQGSVFQQDLRVHSTLL